MQVRSVNVYDDTQFARFHQIMDAAERFERPLATLWSLREAQVVFRKPESTERLEAWGAYDDDGELVGAGSMSLPLADNRHTSWLTVWVEPERRRRGVGGAVLERLVAQSLEAGRTDLIGESAYALERREDHPYRRFAEKHGFTVANTEIRRVLDLPVDIARLDGFIEESARRHAGYRIETYRGGVPERLQASLCHVSNQLAVDAPTGDLDFEPEAMTPGVYREFLDKVREQERTFLSTVALSPDGEVVAYNDLVVSTDDPANVMQWGTLVLREHRGRRLGMAVKARGLKELQALHPDGRRVFTSNAEQNPHMVSINEALGFRAVEAMPSFLRRERL